MAGGIKEQMSLQCGAATEAHFRRSEKARHEEANQSQACQNKCSIKDTTCGFGGREVKGEVVLK